MMQGTGMDNLRSVLSNRKIAVMQGVTPKGWKETYLEVYVAGNRYEQAQFAEMLIHSRCTKAKSPETADLVIFTGGPDVNPALYGEACHPRTRYSDPRDNEDIALYMKCIDLGIPMLGICRGAQFIHVMMGGKLYQDVDHHNGDHHIWDTKNKICITEVSSVHHQMVRPGNPGMEVLAEVRHSKERWLNDKDVDRTTGHADIEAFFYRDICAIGIQGHPEYRGYTKFAQWTTALLDDLICCNPDLDWINKNRRLREDIRAQRNLRWAQGVKEDA